jgi:hypothetical protein
MPAGPTPPADFSIVPTTPVDTQFLGNLTYRNTGYSGHFYCFTFALWRVFLCVAMTGLLAHYQPF